jgi:hypothetical protein
MSTEGCEYWGTIIQQLTKRVPVLFVRKGDLMMRFDQIDLQSMALQTGFGSNAQTLLTINGQTSQQPQPIFLLSADDVARFVLGIWQAETGELWELKERIELPKSEMEWLQEYQMQQQVAQMATVFGRAVQYSLVNLAIMAQSKQLGRQAVIRGTLFLSQQPQLIAASQNCNLSIMVSMVKFPKNQVEQEILGILAGISHSLHFSPQHALSALGRFTEELPLIQGTLNYTEQIVHCIQYETCIISSLVRKNSDIISSVSSRSLSRPQWLPRKEERSQALWIIYLKLCGIPPSCPVMGRMQSLLS